MRIYLYGNDGGRMKGNENVMFRWMCGVTLRDKVPMVELRQRLGIDGVVEVMGRGRLRWFWHVERKKVDDWENRRITN